MFVVPALAGIRAKNRLKAGLQTVRFQPRSIPRYVRLPACGVQLLTGGRDHAVEKQGAS